MKKFKISINAPVVLGFAGLYLLATVLGMISDGHLTQLLFMTYHSSLANPMTWLRFFTHVLGHASWAHFMGNTMYLLLLGPLLEEKYGAKQLVSVILITALVTGLINYIFFPGVALCGSSGVVFAFILLSSFTSFREGEIPLTFILVAVLFIGQQIIEGIAVQDNISNMGHIIGGMVGSFAGYQLNRRTR